MPSARPRRRFRALKRQRRGGRGVAAVLVAAAALSGALIATAAAATAPATANAVHRVVVDTTRHGSLGTILVTSKNFTLYHYSLDTAKRVRCTGNCAEAWPPLLLPKGVAHATAGKGVIAGRLGTVRRPGGTLQVTYAGMPLYRYAGDSKPGQTTGQGVGGTWHVVKASASASSAATVASTGGGKGGWGDA